MFEKDIISFFLNHPEYFINTISEIYPLSKSQLAKYKNILDWNKVSGNLNIEWSGEILNSFSESLDWKSITTNSAAFKNLTLLEEFSDRIDWKGSDKVFGHSIAFNEGLPWDIPFIEKFESKIDISKLSSNTKVKWSEELFIKYLGKWDLVELSGNESFPWTLELFDKYLDESFLFYFATYNNVQLISNVYFIDKYKDSLKWNCICSHSNLPWFRMNLLNRWEKYIDWWGIAQNHFLFLNDPNFFATHSDKWSHNNFKNFQSLSINEVLPWSIRFIERYEEYLSWYYLCANEGVPWNIELIDRFSENINWGGWTPEMIHDEGEFCEAKTYETGLNFNTSVPWSIEFLKYYEKHLEFDALASNHAVWEKAFKPFVDDKMIETVMKIIL